MAERSSRTSADELITQLVDHVFALSGQFLEAGDTITAPEGLSAARWLVLGALQDGPKTPAEIARRRGLARQSTVESVARLERSAHVARRAGSDRRTFLVELTDKGRRALSGIEPRRRAWATETAGQVETEQLEHAVAVLARLRAAPRPVDPFPPDTATSPDGRVQAQGASRGRRRGTPRPG